MVVHEGGRILVTGALGQIGTDLVQSLRDIYGSDHVIASDIKEKKTTRVFKTVHIPI